LGEGYGAVLPMPVGENRLGGYEHQGAADAHGEGRRYGSPGARARDQQYGAEGEGAEVEARRGVAEVQLPPEEGHDRPQHRLHKREEANQAISHPGGRVPHEAGLLHELLRISTLTWLLRPGEDSRLAVPMCVLAPVRFGRR